MNTMIIRLSDIIKIQDSAYIFEDDFDYFLLSEWFEKSYGKYVPFCYKFRKIDGVIYYPSLDSNYFSSVETITVQDMLFKNYSPLKITTKNNKIFILDGHHRSLRFLILCLENNINLSTIELKYNYIQIKDNNDKNRKLIGVN